MLLNKRIEIMLAISIIDYASSASWVNGCQWEVLQENIEASQGWVNFPMFHITQLKRGYNLQQIFEGDVKRIPIKGHLPNPVSI